MFRVVAVPLLLEDHTTIGTLYVATILDQHYAEELAKLTGARTALVSERLLTATTLPGPTARQFESAVARARPSDGTMKFAGEWYAFRRVDLGGDTSFYTLQSIDEASQATTRQVMWSLRTRRRRDAGGSRARLAHRLTEPIGRLSQSLTAMAASHDVEGRLPLTGSSRADALTEIQCADGVARQRKRGRRRRIPARSARCGGSTRAILTRPAT